MRIKKQEWSFFAKAKSKSDYLQKLEVLWLLICLKVASEKLSLISFFWSLHRLEGSDMVKLRRHFLPTAVSICQKRIYSHFLRYQRPSTIEIAKKVTRGKISRIDSWLRLTPSSHCGPVQQRCGISTKMAGACSNFILVIQTYTFCCRRWGEVTLRFCNHKRIFRFRYSAGYVIEKLFNSLFQC